MNAPERHAGGRPARFRLVRRRFFVRGASPARSSAAGSPRALLCNGLLALVSVVVCLAACEAALRLFRPGYQLAVNPLDENTANTYWRQHHPDTHVKHRIYHNNLGSRQSRDFPSESLDQTVNIAFFGDSQTENALMPAQYSYTEPLDFLLNLNVSIPASDWRRGVDAPSPRRPFSVLSFGTRNYGPGQSYLRWRRLSMRGKLAHVFYMAVGNDLDDLRYALRSGIVQLGESGVIGAGQPPRTSKWKRLLGRLQLTYLAIDGWRGIVDVLGVDETGAGRARPLGGAADLPDDEALRVFRELVRRWKGEVEADGGVFHVVLLPNPPAGWGTATEGRQWFREEAALPPELDVLDLHECFAAAVPGFDYRDWRFANDLHWNPAANMVAATCLYRYLESELGLPKLADEDLAHARHAYYQAFLDSSAWEGQRYMPDAVWARPPDRRGGWRSATRGDAIVAKYLALEVAPPLEDEWRGAVRAAREAGALATTAGWNVYANLRERLLVYVKSPCPADWHPKGRFFLHIVPFTPEKLSADQARLGFANLDGGPFSALHRIGGECVFSVPLPPHPLSTVRTGRYAAVGEGADAVYDDLWSAAFPMPLARSVWDVFAGASGRGLDYVKTPCGPADTKARFFLHVFPLPPARRYANLDFAWGGAGVSTDGACRISVALPDHPIAFVRTGQFRDGVVATKRLWGARIDFAEVERAGARLRSVPATQVETR